MRPGSETTPPAPCRYNSAHDHGNTPAVGEVIAFAEIVRMRRQRVARAAHVRCRALIAASVASERLELVIAPVGERPVRLARLRKLEQLDEYASALG